MSPKQIKITSDGVGPNTVITTETGEVLEVTRATIWMDAREINRVDLEMLIPNVSVTAKPGTVTFLCPVCERNSEHKCKGEVSGNNSGSL